MGETGSHFDQRQKSTISADLERFWAHTSISVQVPALTADVMLRRREAMASGKDPKLDIGPIGGAKAPQGIEGAAGIDPAASTQSAQGASEVDDISRALAAGEIDAAEAQRRLVESVIAEQLPSDASPELSAAIRAEVEGLLANDPTLSALLSAPA